METIKAIFIAPGCEPQEILLPKDDQAHYRQARALVGGTIDVVGLYEKDDLSVHAIINDEGLLLGLPPNVRERSGRLLVGNIIVTAERTDAEGDTVYCDVPDNTLALCKAWLADGERPGRVEYDVPPAQVFGGEDFDKYMRGELQPKPQITQIVGMTGDHDQFIGSRRS